MENNKKLLIVVDMQNDFINGTLGTPEAVAIIPNVVKKISEWDGDIVYTQDTHLDNYLETNEGRHLPVPHCIMGTEGHKIESSILSALSEKKCVEEVLKPTFGSIKLAEKARAYEEIEIIGLCTDICVISNALLIKAYCPESAVSVDASCCAGVTSESHNAAITTMKMCQIDVIGE